MTRTTIGVSPDGSGKRIALDRVDDAGTLSDRQIIRLAGDVPAQLQAVLNAAPGASEYGAVVRNIPVGVLVAVPYDALVPTYAATTETWAYKVGGSGGVTVATVVVTYTDGTKLVIASIERTYP